MPENPHHSTPSGNDESFEQLVRRLGGTPVRIQPGRGPINPLDHPGIFSRGPVVAVGPVRSGKSSKAMMGYLMGENGRGHRLSSDG